MLICPIVYVCVNIYKQFIRLRLLQNTRYKRIAIKF
jgi:hypothetical protein